MAEQAPVAVPITTRGDPSGVKQLQDAFASLFGSLKLGFGIDVVRRFNDALLMIPQTLSRAVEEGIRFNSVLESSRLGIAAVVQATNPQTVLDFNSALAASDVLMGQLKIRALTTASSYESLVEGFQAFSGLMTSAGIALRDQVELSGLIAQTVTGLGLPDRQIIQEGRALFEGRLNSPASSIGKVLQGVGITDAAVKKWKQDGTVVKELTSRLAAFKTAGELAAESYAGLVNNLGDIGSQQKAAATEGLFDALKEILRDLQRVVASDEFQSNLKAVADTLAAVVTAIRELVGNDMSPVKWMLDGVGQMWGWFKGGVGAIATYQGARFGGASHEEAQAEAWKVAQDPNRNLRAGAAGGGALPDDIIRITGEPTDVSVGDARMQDQLRREQKNLQFSYQNKLIDLETFLKERRRLVQEYYYEGFIEQKQVLDELHETDLEALKAQIDLADLRGVAAGGVISPTGLAAKGIYTGRGESAVLDRQVSLQTRMVDVLEQIRDELKAKMPSVESYV